MLYHCASYDLRPKAPAKTQMVEALKLCPRKAMDVLGSMIDYKAANSHPPPGKKQRKKQGNGHGVDREAGNPHPPSGKKQRKKLKCKHGVDDKGASPDSPGRDRQRKKRKEAESLESATSHERRFVPE